MHKKCFMTLTAIFNVTQLFSLYLTKGHIRPRAWETCQLSKIFADEARSILAYMKGNSHG